MTTALYFTLGFASLQASAESAAGVIERLRTNLPITAVQETTESLPGRYSSGDGLSGDFLHLFPDGTYLYSMWADIEPLTGYDKGTWQVSGALLELVSDPDVTWDPRAERQYATVRRDNHPEEILLIGLERDLPYVEEKIRDRDNLVEHSFLFLALARNEIYDLPTGALTKVGLMRDLWNTHYFTLFPKMVNCTVAFVDPATLGVSLGTSSSRDIDADVFTMLILEPSPSRAPTDFYWATFDVETGRSFGRSPWGQLRLRARETLRTEILHSNLLWAPNVESASPDRPVAQVVPPGRYTLRFFVQGLVRGYIVESNRLDVLVDTNGIASEVEGR